MVDWEMKARHLNDSLKTLGAIAAGAGLVNMFIGEGALFWLGAWLFAIGVIVLCDERIAP
jgi:hypothetical protein